MARPESKVYDVRALYGDGLTWVVRHHSLLGALWYLWARPARPDLPGPGLPARSAAL